MYGDISEQLFRLPGSHALKKLVLAESYIEITVAPWINLKSGVTAIFNNVTIEYVESDSNESTLTFNLPWDIVRIDSQAKDNGSWKFGICCSEFIIGFVSDWPIVQGERP